MSVDPAAHQGANHLCLDATPLIHFNNEGHLTTLAALVGNPAFTPQYILDQEIRAPMQSGAGLYRKNSEILAAPWLFGASLSDVAGIERVARLKRRLGGTPNQNLGEAHVIALAERYGWTVVMEDEGGRLAAADPRDGPVVPTIYMVTLLALGAGFGVISARDAWKVHKALEETRRRSILRTERSDKQVFDRCVGTFGKLSGKTEPWPQVLARGRALDDLIVLERRLS
jgi:hypothetical protein